MTTAQTSALRSRWRLLAPWLLCLGVLAWASGWQNYSVFLLTQVLVYAIALLGLNLLLGYGGQVSVGHGAFFALGGYGVAVLASLWGWPYHAAVPAAVLLCYGVGVLVGFPALRLPMLYLALSTFAIAVVTPQALKYRRIEWLTGGVQGLALRKPEFPWFAGQSAEWGLLVVTALSALCALLLLRRLLHSPLGRLVDAARDHALAAEACAVNVVRVKTQLFGISAAYTGLAGALGALGTLYVSPESYPFLLSVSLLVGSMVAGIRSLWACLLGAAFIVLVPNFGEMVAPAAPGLVLGGTLVLLVFIAPDGIGARVQQVARFARARFGSRR